MSWQLSMHLTVQSKRRCICAHTEVEQLTRLEKGNALVYRDGLFLRL